jgi:hypothetical protein
MHAKHPWRLRSALARLLLDETYVRDEQP